MDHALSTHRLLCEIALIHCETGDKQAHLWTVTPVVIDERIIGPNMQFTHVSPLFSNVSFLTATFPGKSTAV